MYQCGSPGRPLYIGFEHYTIPHLESAIHNASSAGMSFVVSPVSDEFTPPPINRAATGFMTEAFGSRNSEMTMRMDNWNQYVVVKIDSDVDEQPYPLCVNRSNEMFRLIHYMRQLMVPAVMINLRTTENTNLANIINELLKIPHSVMVWTRVAMESKPENMYKNYNQRRGKFYKALDEAQLKKIEEECGTVRLLNPWQCWSTLHEKVDFSRNVQLVLELPVMVPEGDTIRRWSAEPIAAIIVPTHLFFNRSKRPILGYPHQRVLVELVSRTNAVVIIGGKPIFAIESYVSNLRRVWLRNYSLAEIRLYHHAQAWADHVQLQIQPYQEDFEARTYMLLKNDNVKYFFYEKAIKIALQKKMTKNRKRLQSTPHSLVNDESQGIIRVAVLGAGRGPLVSHVLNAAAVLNARVKVYAIEKNPLAALSLETRKACEWVGYDVEILREDCRLSTISPKCDIAVFEQLGSWGDNELAPEFIDGARNILTDDCTYIPRRYTSYVAPISSSKVWASARTGGNPSIYANNNTFLETIWVSYMRNKADLAEPKAVFTFDHPSEAVKIDDATVMEREGVPKVDHSRVANLSWTVNKDSVMHGFAGYFQCKLLNQSCEFNTLPRTYTKGLTSWFPVFIPLKKPIRLSKGYTVNATFWRRTDVGRVWYEWKVETEGYNSGVHNLNARSSVIHCPF